MTSGAPGGFALQAADAAHMDLDVFHAAALELLEIGADDGAAESAGVAMLAEGRVVEQAAIAALDALDFWDSGDVGPGAEEEVLAALEADAPGRQHGGYRHGVRGGKRARGSSYAVQ